MKGARPLARSAPPAGMTKDEVRAHARRGGASPWAVAAADVAADLLGAAALAYGSARERSPVL